MAGLTFLNPIHILPLTPPSSDAPSTITTIDSSSLWDCELLQPPPSLPVRSGSCDPLNAPSFHAKPDQSSSSGEICDAPLRLMELLSISDSRRSNANIAAQHPRLGTFPPSDPIGTGNDLHAIPATHRPRAAPPPPPYAMHPPLTSTQRSHFSSYRLRIRPSPKSTMSFKVAAPAPRIPLATVLQYWGANEAHPPQDPGPSRTRVDVKMEVDTNEPVYEDGVPKAGLGLILGLTPSPGPQSRPYPDTHTRTHSQSQSQSRSRYCRRLRRLAPSPLQLTPPTPCKALLTPAASPVTPAPVHLDRTPASGVFVDVPLATRQGLSSSFDLNCIPTIPSIDRTQPKFPSASPETETETDRAAGPSISSAMATIPAAPTPLVFPSGESENVVSYADTTHAAATDVTADSWYVDLLSWRRTVSRALDSPLSPFRTPKSAKRSTPTASASANTNPPPAAATPLRSAAAAVGAAGEVFGNLSQLTPGLPHDTAPPPPPRMGCNPLPEFAEFAEGEVEEEEEPVVYPQHADLTWELDTESLMLWTEKCSETIARASLSLRSCGLLKDPDAIASLCDDLRRAFATVQRALEATPRDFVADGSEARQTWYADHCDAVQSLCRNMERFHMLARRVEDRPPRIHRLEGVLRKLATYRVKFADVARRIEVSHEKLRLLTLKTELTNAHALARAQALEERRRRREERAARQEGRMRRHALREEIRRVRGSIRAMRDVVLHHHHPQHHLHHNHQQHDQDENVFFLDRHTDGDGDYDMGGSYSYSYPYPYDGRGAKWRFGDP